MDYYNSWLRDDLETLRKDIEIALVIYDIRIDLLPTAIENVIEKSQALIKYVVKDTAYAVKDDTRIYSDSYNRDCWDSLNRIENK